MTSSNEAWNSSSHAQIFDYHRFVPSALIPHFYEDFNEVRLLRTALPKADTRATILDYGCATGEFHRYVRSRYPHATYVGCDISKPAIDRAREKFPKGNFILTDEEFSGMKDVKPDVVFCRDVVHHQPRALDFTSHLYSLAKNVLILRIRTRDAGASVLDPETSCQLNYGRWVPYIVFNCDELKQFFRQQYPAPAELRIWKNHMVLGGSHLRFLPKDCYLPETRTAETGLMVRKGEGTLMIEEKVAADRESSSAWAFHAHFRHAAAIAVGTIAGRNYSGETRW